MTYSSLVRASGLALLSLFAGPAIAADPVEVPQSGRQIQVGVDETKIFRFDERITKVEVSRNGIVEAVPRSQTEISLFGLNTGRTPMFVFGEGGKRIYAGTVSVTLDPGHLVRIYRQPAKEEKDAAAAGKSDAKTDAADDYWCTDVRCSARLPPPPGINK
jgi:Flp pilus assembly secretin CpaC